MMPPTMRKAWLFAARAPGTRKDEADLARVLGRELAPSHIFRVERTEGPATRGVLRAFINDIGD